MSEPTEPTIRLINRTGAPDGYDDMEFAVLDLTLNHALALLKKMGVAGVFAAEEGFHRVTFFDYSIDYYREPLNYLHDLEALTDEEYGNIEENVDNCGWVEIPICNLGEQARTECETLAIDQNSLVWKAYPKHGSQQIETQCLMRDDLAAYAHQLMQMHAVQTAKEAATGREHRVIQIDRPGS